jgi:hypothetical protein
MMRTDPRRGRTRRPQLELEPRAARSAALARVADSGPATAPPAARDGFQKRLAHKLGAPRGDPGGSARDARTAPQSSPRSRRRGIAQTTHQARGGQAG